MTEADEMIWICPQCGVTNHGSGYCECESPRPDYHRHVQVLNLGGGPVFNGPVPVFNGPINVAIMSPEKALTAFYGEDVMEKEPCRPTSWEQFTDFCVQLVFWSIMFVIFVAVVIFALLFLGVAFGW